MGAALAKLSRSEAHPVPVTMGWTSFWSRFQGAANVLKASKSTRPKNGEVKKTPEVAKRLPGVAAKV